MCRLVAYAGSALPVDRLMFGGRHSLLRQSWAPRELLSGSVNADGYGVVWYDDARPAATPVRVARAEPPWYDPDLPGLLASAQAPVAMAALRNATPGLPVDRSGLLPLVQGPWSFVLNGWVPDFRARHARALRAALPDELYAALGGPSDAETLFLLALARIEGDGATPLEALEGVVRSVSERLDASERAPLTMILASAEGVWGLNAAAGGGPCNSMWVAKAPALAPDGVLLASEALDDDPAWERVPPHARVELRPDGSVRIDDVRFGN